MENILDDILIGFLIDITEKQNLKVQHF